MSETELGETFDIHGGGLDLVFPHHENEIAQSVCAHDGRPFARYWLHNGMLTVGGAKMAKSEGNFITVRDVLANGPDQIQRGEAMRLALLGTHYRDPLDWTDDRLRQARHSLYRFYVALAQSPRVDPKGEFSAPKEIIDALEDDLNTPKAITHLHSIADEIFHSQEESLRAVRRPELVGAGRLLGLFAHEKDAINWLQGGIADISGRIHALIGERAQARREQRYSDADRIRAELAGEGIVLEDKPDGTTTWRSA
jgi:cysteinyl-tRNA synthetase